MLRTVFGLLLISAASFSFHGTSYAASLPKSAKPMTASEVRSIYAGKTALWSKSNVYFAPDGKTIGYSKNKKFVFSGKWSVVGKRACMKNTWKEVKTGKSGKTTDCWDWYRDGNEVWTLWSKRYDGSRPKKKDFTSSELKKLRPGNLVGAQYSKLSR